VTKKQVEYADRLSRGYSVEDIENGKKTVRKISRFLHNDFIYEEENPCLRLIDRVQQSQEISKETRKQAEAKMKREPGTAVKQQVLSLGLEARVIVDENCKFYTKSDIVNYKTHGR
jgi:hypothetical protein